MNAYDIFLVVGKSVALPVIGAVLGATIKGRLEDRRLNASNNYVHQCGFRN